MALIVSIQQVASNVVVTINGSVNLAGLTNVGNGGSGTEGIFSGDTIRFAPSATSLEWYQGINGVATGPFGSNSSNPFVGAYTTTDYIVLANLSNSTGQIRVPAGYTSGTVISNSMTFTSSSFFSLGLNVGTYVYSWGSGANADSVTVYVGVTPPSPTTINAPLPFSWSLIGVNATGVVSTSSVTGSFAGFTVVSGSATFTGLKDANGVNLASIASPLIVSAGVTYPIFVTSASLSSGAVLFYP